LSNSDEDETKRLNERDVGRLTGSLEGTENKENVDSASGPLEREGGYLRKAKKQKKKTMAKEE
jgi:hypothetical protein